MRRQTQLNRSIGFKYRNQSHIEFADQAAVMLQDVLPEGNAATAAAATLSFEFRGRFSNGNMYGLGVLTNAQTYGHAPLGCGGPNEYACQMLQNGRIQLTDDDAANIILGCFGLDVIDVLNHYGTPIDGERKTLTLQTILTDIVPELLETPVAAAAVA